MYKVQLFNATQTIDSLEGKLQEYQKRRHNIAENLHSIMESQWKQTVELLTNPSNRNYSQEFANHDMSETESADQVQHHVNMAKFTNSQESLKSEILRSYIDKVRHREI